MTDEITLIGYQRATASGVLSKTEVRNTVLCEIGSPTRAEWGSAGQNGINAGFVARTPIENYDWQEQAIFRGKLYSIYRTFLNEKTGEVELYLEQKTGREAWAIPSPRRPVTT